MKERFNMKKYLELIKNIADNNLQIVQDNGSIKAGCNGPYNHKDTAIRNTAHWIVTYSVLYKLYKDERYFNLIIELADYLLEESNYGKCNAIICQKDDSKVFTNGLIGQAWAIEGLVYAYKTTNKNIYIEKAKELFFVQEFDLDKFIWKIVDDEDESKYDYVYNHQLWFAASGSMICDVCFDEKIDDEIRKFLSNFARNFAVQPSGLIFHLINCETSTIANIKFKIKAILTDLGISSRWKELKYLEEGYHLFDLYGFALLKKQYGNEPIFKSKQLNKSIRYATNKRTIEKLGINEQIFNKYSYGYNSPAFEFPFVDKMLNSSMCIEEYSKILDRQINITFDQNEKMFSKNNNDKYTLTARVYELARYFE